MPILYKETPWDLVCDDEHLTEQEHIDSCDANKILKAALRGQMVLSSRGEPQYGYDDTTMDGLSFRIQKQKLEEELGSLPKDLEFEENDFNQISPQIREKFGLKVKKAKKLEAKNDELNDDKTPPKQPVQLPEPNP